MDASREGQRDAEPKKMQLEVDDHQLKSPYVEGKPEEAVICIPISIEKVEVNDDADFEGDTLVEETPTISGCDDSRKGTFNAKGTESAKGISPCLLMYYSQAGWRR